MDCSVQYTESGPCPKEEMGERGQDRACIHVTAPRARRVQLWNGIRVDAKGFALLFGGQ